MECAIELLQDAAPQIQNEAARTQWNKRLRKYAQSPGISSAEKAHDLEETADLLVTDAPD